LAGFPYDWRIILTTASKSAVLNEAPAEYIPPSSKEIETNVNGGWINFGSWHEASPSGSDSHTASVGAGLPTPSPRNVNLGLALAGNAKAATAPTAKTTERDTIDLHPIKAPTAFQINQI
jgi:hypothetical protein